MTARNTILAAVKASQPALKPLPDVYFPADENADLKAKFTEILTTIGGKVITAEGSEEIAAYIKTITNFGDRIESTVDEVYKIVAEENPSLLPHSLQNTELAVIKAHFGVAENGAVWITEDLLSQRVLPFITQHLIVVLNAADIVANMHQAYERIGDRRYGFGTFIAGPSKTADIEQSLVLGAHGSRSMTVFLMR